MFYLLNNHSFHLFTQTLFQSFLFEPCSKLNRTNTFFFSSWFLGEIGIPDGPPELVGAAKICFRWDFIIKPTKPKCFCQIPFQTHLTRMNPSISVINRHFIRGFFLTQNRIKPGFFVSRNLESRSTQTGLAKGSRHFVWVVLYWCER